MGVTRCQNCGQIVNSEAMGCPGCGADPRTGELPKPAQEQSQEEEWERHAIWLEAEQYEVRIDFEVGGEPSWFTWSKVSGGAKLAIGDEVVVLANPLNPMTHLKDVNTLTRTWKHTHDGHEVEVTKRRSLLMAVSHPMAFTVRVDGEFQPLERLEAGRGA